METEEKEKKTTAWAYIPPWMQCPSSAVNEWTYKPKPAYIIIYPTASWRDHCIYFKDDTLMTNSLYGESLP